MAVRKRIIECVLSPESVDSAIKELQDYKDELQDKHKQLVDRLAKIGIKVAEERYAEASAGSIEAGKMTAPDSAVPTLEITTEDGGLTAVIQISGHDVTFIEFGSGVHFNAGYAGKPATTNAGKFGYTIGGYGTGLGLHEAWHYGSGKISYGTPAADATGKIEEEIKNQIRKVVREIYG